MIIKCPSCGIKIKIVKASVRCICGAHIKIIKQNSLAI